MHALIEAHRDDIARLCRQYGVQRLDAFGSITRSDFDVLRSDVDLVAEFAAPPDGDLAAQYFDFKQHLEDLLRRPVDLIELQAVRNQRLRREIEATRVPIVHEDA